MAVIEEILKERGKTHGDFEENARISQTMKSIFCTGSSFDSLPLAQKEAASVIIAKLARIVTGNPMEPDHWVDIQGYAKLGEKSIERSKATDR